MNTVFRPQRDLSAAANSPSRGQLGGVAQPQIGGLPVTVDQAQQLRGIAKKPARQ